MISLLALKARYVYLQPTLVADLMPYPVLHQKSNILLYILLLLYYFLIPQ